MKMKRFASVFFILALVLSLVAVPLAAPAEEGSSAPVMEVAAKAALLVLNLILEFSFLSEQLVQFFLERPFLCVGQAWSIWGWEALC